MTRETCATCRFYMPPGPDDEGVMGVCRRSPKQWTGPDEIPGWEWPPHHRYDWCGEHQPVAPAAPASDDYTRAAVRYAEAMLIEGTSQQEAEACDAFIKAYWQRHGG